MAGKDYVHGCTGCIDFAVQQRTCDYLLNNGHCRPVPAGKKGCMLKAKTYAQRARLREKHRWDPAQALELIKGGTPLVKAAEQLGASPNALKAMLAGGSSEGYIFGMPWKKRNAEAAAEKQLEVSAQEKVSEPAERSPRRWIREKEFLELYEKGLLDYQVAAEMDLNEMTIWKHRKKLGLPPNRFRQKKGSLKHGLDEQGNPSH